MQDLTAGCGTNKQAELVKMKREPHKIVKGMRKFMPSANGPGVCLPIVAT
jgi:hypothetical protein